MKKLFTLLFFCYFPFLSSAEEDRDVYKYLNLFGEAFEKIKNNYVEDVTSKELIESAIEGMLSSLDPHSTYFGTLAEIGLIGFISVIIILFFFLIIIFKLKILNINSYKNIALISIVLYYILVSINIDILNFRHLWIIFAIIILLKRINITESKF